MEADDTAAVYEVLEKMSKPSKTNQSPKKRVRKQEKS